MQRDSAVPRPIQRNINATAADLDMNWRRGAPAPAPAPAARPPAPRLAAPKESPWGAVPAAPAADLRSGGGGGPAPRPAAERAPAARASARGSRGAREGGRPGREAGGAARRGGDAPRASPERRPRDAPRPPPSPPRPPYVPPPAPWAGAARAARPAAAPTRDFPTLGAAPPPAPPPEPPRAAPPRAPEPAAPRDRAVARGAAAPRNPWGAPGGPAPPAPGGDFPALAPPARNSPPVVLAALDKPAGAGYLKPKPQANFVVFDVLTSKLRQKAPRGKKAPETPKPAPAPAPKPPGADDDRPAAPDKVRKKKLSSLKKRILLERAERWYELHPEARPAPTIRDEATSGAFADATGVGRRFVVRVDNVATRGELEDAEERDEILRDVGCLCSHLAPVVAVEVAPAAAGTADDFAPIDVSFAARDDAAAALAGLERRVVGGVALRAAERPPSPPPDSISTAARVFGALDADDAADADAVDETRDDLARLAEAYGPLAAPPRLEPSRVAALRGCLDAVLDFGDARAAARAVAGLGRTTIGGATLLCDVEPGSTLAKSVDEILAAARDMGVPVVFALGKRKLGRALRKSVGVSAVGVYSGDGAYDEYRAVTNRLKELQRDPACAVDPAFVQEQRQRGRGAEPKPDGAPPRTDQADAPSAKRPRGRRKAPQTQPAKPPAPSFDFQPPLPGAAQQPPPQLWPAPYVAF
ncbi:hypothetical protein AURANDRAFT_61299 [Aureococcus anophagefferens]|uniref:Ribosomal protein L7Ae/L30e/S12e/Gadd45 domain-containing protein n=1 Tax=Aureococcus anophagefferens TaxID=44056 RepID=F0XXU5_AURAN|nr:hypothetical protein AURANDRAFT_61299 [Aureococcus anophagefferens]EGB12005.1 hypothetical protein AURANDRAFT_61299 [Aureococcus anophagefferens]|eukprot:XP_009033106.1 hypothetical protein AURANDRAFT_61299 [Aureococcus anophagefferens]